MLKKKLTAVLSLWALIVSLFAVQVSPAFAIAVEEFEYGLEEGDVYECTDPVTAEDFDCEYEGELCSDLVTGEYRDCIIENDDGEEFVFYVDYYEDDYEDDDYDYDYEDEDDDQYDDYDQDPYTGLFYDYVYECTDPVTGEEFDCYYDDEICEDLVTGEYRDCIIENIYGEEFVFYVEYDEYYEDDYDYDEDYYEEDYYDDYDPYWEDHHDHHGPKHHDDHFYDEKDGYKGYGHFGYEDYFEMDFYQLEENLEELFWLLDTLDEVYFIYDEEGVDMDSDLEEKILDFEGDLIDLMENIEEVLDMDDPKPEDVHMANEEFFQFMHRDPWRIIDHAFEMLDSFYFQDDIKGEVASMLEDLKDFKVFIDAFEDQGEMPTHVDRSMNILKQLAQEVREAMEKLQTKIESGDDIDPEKMDEVWEYLDEAGEIAHEHMRVVAEYLMVNEDIRSALEQSIPEELGMVMMMAGDGPRHEDDYEEEFMEYYGDFDSQDLEEEMYRHIMQEVSRNLMKELAPHLGDEEAADVIFRVMNNMDILPEGMASNFLENHNALLNELDFDPADIKHHKDDFKMFIKQLKEMPIPDEYIDEVTALLEQLKVLKKADASSDEMEEVKEELKELLEEIERENNVGDNATRFYDVDYDQWYWEHVMKNKHKSVIQGYSDDQGPTGYFGPADDVRLIEVLAISMRLAGVADTDTEWPDGYLELLDDMEISDLNSNTYADWGRPAGRGEALVIMNRVLGIEAVEYVEGTFPDIDASDTIAGDAMASYMAGFFTGEGETGELNPGARMNRAAFAKVAGIGIDYFEEEDFADEFLEFASEF